jgi:hypothetical protein
MNRKSFAFGIAIGAMLGTIGTLAVTLRLRSAAPRSPIVPASSIVIESEEPDVERNLPPDSTKRYFNGKPYYLVPLASVLEMPD